MTAGRAGSTLAQGGPRGPPHVQGPWPSLRQRSNPDTLGVSDFISVS